MFLKRLEIYGFKSFSEKVNLHFKEGVTAIVGPNGSGKSNLSDAIRWVLGEQSAKTLRGEKMEDVIFAGTKNRKPLGYCQVSIVFDNTDKRLNVDFSEVVITRRVYRSGESSYFVNGSACRLKYVHELFMDTGIGKEGYSIIGQGKIDSILSSKSEDRRVLFEEAAGIIKFKTRRVQAETKLEEVLKNLVRVEDIISEIERQLVPLETQEKQARKFLDLSEKLKHIKVNLFVQDYENTEKELIELEKNIAKIKQEEEILESNKIEIKQEEETVKFEINENEKNISDLNKDSEDIKLKIEKEETEVKLNLQSIEYLKSDLNRINNEKTSLNEKVNLEKEEVKKINSSLSDYQNQVDKREEELGKLLNESEEYTNKAQDLEENIKHLKEKNDENEELSAKLFETINDSRNSKVQFEDKLSRMTEEQSFVKSRQEEVLLRKKVLEENIKDLNQQELDKKEKLEKENLNFNNTLQRLNSLKKDLENLNREYDNFANRQKILTELEKDYEGYFDSVKAILMQRNKSREFDGICGVVGELINVSKEHEVALEVALGQTVQNIITNTDEDAKIAIEYLKNNKKGRATFLPLNSIKPKSIEKGLEKEKGFVGIASDLIDFDQKYFSIFSNLLGRVVIIDNIDNAILFAKKFKYLYKLVTLDGQVINAGGSFTGGSFFKKAGGVFSRARELKEIKEKIKDLLKTLENKKDEINLTHQNESKIKININLEEEALKEIFQKKTVLLSELKQTEVYINENSAKILKIESDINYLNEEFSNNFKGIVEIEKNLKLLYEEIEKDKKSIFDFSSDLKEINKLKEDKVIELSDIKIKLSEVKNILDNKNREIDRINKELETHLQNKISLDSETKQKLEKIELLNQEIKNKKVKIQSLNQEYEEFKLNNQTLYNQKVILASKLEDLVNKNISISNSINELNNKKVRLEARKENIETSIERLSHDMWENYEVTYADACNNFEKSDLAYDILQKNGKDIKTEISKLGSVNVSAIEEYKELKERHEQSVSQKDDILKAIDDLKNLIKTLTTEMETKFKENFSIINKNFKEVFSKIFGGGSAYLKLSDESNVLSSGIEINAQPPGKALQSLSLLSGGERTLTAMALLFSIFIIKPSPFCMLDETDAALDDANVSRYAKFLKEFSEKNQFILITHKTGTMEVADFLYGVTMQEQGVSKVVSVELKEAMDY